MTTTTNYGWTKPTVGGDANTWGAELNTDLDSIDSTVFTVSGVANAALPKAGGTMTGALVGAGGSVSLPTFTFTGDLDNGLYYIGANNWGLAVGGAAGLTFTTTAATAGKPLITLASATGAAGFNLPPGVAPTSPNNGDLWLTSTAILARIGGVTVTLGASAGAGLLSTNNLSDVASASTSRTNLGLGTSATVNTGTSGATVPLLSAANTWTLAQTFSAAAVFSVAPTFTDASGTRTALGLGTSSTVNTGTSGATIPLLNGVNTWASAQTFSSTVTLSVAPVFTDASGSRTALGLGTSATVNTGTSGATIPLLNGANTYTTTQTFTAAPVFTDASGSRTALGLGTAATQNTGTSGANVPLLNGANTFSGLTTLSAGGVMTPAATPATNAIGYLGLPQNAQTTAYTTVMGDSGKSIYHNSASAHTITIDSNANVACPIGTVMKIGAAGGGTVTLAITTDTLRWLPSNGTGSRTITSPGFAVVEKVNTTEWWVTGVNLT